MRMWDKLTAGPYFIAEMSANHAGKLENAIEIVHAAKKAGADCLKIQTYTADTITIDCDKDDFLIKGGLWDGRKLYDLYNDAHTPWEWHEPIKKECESIGLDFLSTPFDNTAVDFLESLDVKFYKIASFELVDIPLIEYVAQQQKPIIISTGMGSKEEVIDAVNACIKMGNNQIILLHCCSEYPAEFKNMNLSTIIDMQKTFGVPIGLSDHSPGSMVPIIAASLGVNIVEKHFCLSRTIKNPDSEFSMEPDEFKEMTEQVRQVKTILGKVYYGPTPSERSSLRLRRSIFAMRDIKRGELFSSENLGIIRPGAGVKPKFYPTLLGKKSKQNYKFGDPINEDEL